MDTLEFPYKPKSTTMLLAGGFFAACTAILVYAAQHNDRALRLWHVFRFEREGATTFYWVLAALSAGFVIMAILALLESLLSTEPPVLKLTPDEIIIPPYLFRREPKHILWREVTHVTFQKVQGQHFMTLHHGDRRKAQVTRGWLPDDKAWEIVLMHTMARTGKMGPGR